MDWTRNSIPHSSNMSFNGQYQFLPTRKYPSRYSAEAAARLTPFLLSTQYDYVINDQLADCSSYLPSHLHAIIQNLQHASRLLVEVSNHPSSPDLDTFYKHQDRILGIVNSTIQSLIAVSSLEGAQEVYFDLNRPIKHAWGGFSVDDEDQWKWNVTPGPTPWDPTPAWGTIPTPSSSSQTSSVGSPPPLVAIDEVDAMLETRTNYSSHSVKLTYPYCSSRPPPSSTIDSNRATASSTNSRPLNPDAPAFHPHSNASHTTPHHRRPPVTVRKPVIDFSDQPRVDRQLGTRSRPLPARPLPTQLRKCFRCGSTQHLVKRCPGKFGVQATAASRQSTFVGRVGRRFH